MGNKKSHKKLYAAIIIILLAVVFLSYGFWSGLLSVNFPWGNGDGEGGGGSGGDGAGNGQIILSLSSNAVNREDYNTITVESDLANTLLTFQAQYNGRTEWLTATTYTTDGNGDCSFPFQCNWAGEWLIRAIHVISGATSNMEPLTIRGITLYQQKDTWVVNETYTAALSSTYRNWYVGIWQRHQGDTMWTWAMNAQTDAIGAIDYGVNTAFIDSSQAGTVRQIIGIISPTDPTGYDLWEVFQEIQFDGAIRDSDLNGAVDAGLVVKSNILTVTIQP